MRKIISFSILLLMISFILSLNLNASTKDHPPDKRTCEPECCFKVKQGNTVQLLYRCQLAFVKFNFTIYAHCWNGEYYQEYTCVNGFFTRNDVCCYFNDYIGTSGCPQSTLGEVEAEFLGGINKEYECYKRLRISSCTSYSLITSTEIFPK